MVEKTNISTSLNGKKILLIGMDFYDYEMVIKSALEQRGATVYYCNSRINTIQTRIAKRFGLAVQARVKDRIRFRALKRATTNNDIVFVIKGVELNRKDLNLITNCNRNAQFKLYLWDSISHHSNIDLLFEYFSSVWSFDRKDCLADSRLKFRPTFYREQLEGSVEKRYAVTFVGRIYGNRFEIAKSVRDKLQKENKEYFIKLFMELPDYIFARYITRKLSKKDSELITTRKIPFKEYNEAVKRSFILLDIGHPDHSGLTMRVFDALASGCHILTTNKDIKNYPNISPSLYTIYENNLDLNILSMEPSNFSNLTNYSLDSFIDEIFL